MPGVSGNDCVKQKWLREQVSMSADEDRGRFVNTAIDPITKMFLPTNRQMP